MGDGLCLVYVACSALELMCRDTMSDCEEWVGLGSRGRLRVKLRVRDRLVITFNVQVRVLVRVRLTVSLTVRIS